LGFRQIVGLGVAGCFVLIVVSALDTIVAGVTQAAVILFWLSVAVAISASVIVGYTYWQKRRVELFRLRDGAFPLQRFKLLDGTPILVDPNKMVGAAGAVHPVHGWGEFVPNAGWDNQRAIALAVQNTRHLEAMFPGDAAQEKTQGQISAPRTNVSTAKLLGGPVEKPPKATPTQEAPIVVPPGQRPAVTGQQMIADPQPTRLAIGEDAESGEIVYWDVLNTASVRVHGVTGGGKTALCRMLVAQAIRHGWEVTVLDTRQGKDWGMFRNYARVVDARDPAVALTEIKKEVEHYEERDAVLGKHQASDIQELGQTTGKSYRRRLFVVEEVQSHHINAEFAGGKQYRKAFWMALHKLTKDARATGIHGLYIDQMPSNWAEGVRYNSEAICFLLPDYGGRIAGYVYAHKLEKYHCHFRGSVIKAGHLTDSQIMRTLERAPGGVRRENSYTPTGVNTLRTPVTNTNSEQPTNTPRPASGHEWDDFARAFYAKNPEASQRALTRAMAKIDTEGRPAEAFVGGLSSDLYHRFSPSGSKYQSPDRVDNLPKEKR